MNVHIGIFDNPFVTDIEMSIHNGSSLITGITFTRRRWTILILYFNEQDFHIQMRQIQMLQNKWFRRFHIQTEQMNGPTKHIAYEGCQ